MSTEYIERGAAISVVKQMLSGEGLWGDGASISAEAKLNAIPAADVEPVVHAHWKEVERAEIISDEGHRAIRKMQECTNCHIVSVEKTVRCPHCGAHMDERSKHE